MIPLTIEPSKACPNPRLVGGRADLPVLIANRSAQLMKFAARLLFSRCLHVLTSDLAWPGYLEILEGERDRVNGIISVLPARDAILSGRMAPSELIAEFTAKTAGWGCDGLFLPAVSNDGVRLPVAEIVRAVEEKRRLRFIVVDGAQDFCHASADLFEEHCDLYITGCHKWLAALHPMGLAFYGRRRSRTQIDGAQARLVSTGALDDPLLRLVEEIEAGNASAYHETVNTSSLFSCAGSIRDAEAVERISPGGLNGLVVNSEAVTELARRCGWNPFDAKSEFRSGILLLRPERQKARLRSPEVTRAMFQKCGVALTTYDGGIARLSMPRTPLERNDLDLLEKTLQKTACTMLVAACRGRNRPSLLCKPRGLAVDRRRPLNNFELSSRIFWSNVVENQRGKTSDI